MARAWRPTWFHPIFFLAATVLHWRLACLGCCRSIGQSPLLQGKPFICIGTSGINFLLVESSFSACGDASRQVCRSGAIKACISARVQIIARSSFGGFNLLPSGSFGEAKAGPGLRWSLRNGETTERAAQAADAQKPQRQLRTWGEW